MVVELVVVLTALRLVTVCVWCVQRGRVQVQWKWILMESDSVNRETSIYVLIDYSTPLRL